MRPQGPVQGKRGVLVIVVVVVVVVVAVVVKLLKGVSISSRL